MQKSGRWPKFLSFAALQVILERLLENWQSALTLLITVGGMTWLSTTHQFVLDNAPLSYGVIILLTALIYYIIFALRHFGRSRQALADFEARRARATTINPLKNTFVRDKIKITDFYHDFYQAKELARFEECEFYGPGAMLLDGGHIDVFHTHNCEFVGVPLLQPLYSVAHFKNCTFTKCRFYRVMFVCSKEQLAEIEAQALEDGAALNILCS